MTTTIIMTMLGMADKSNEFGRKFIESCIQATVTFTFFM